ncbi:Cell division and transport-associated protein TolA [Sphingomonas sp. YR710]|nr:Cell division and transport-associated protein TolA [Sphingomonas sp. YR710]
MDRAERAGLAVALVGHAALLAVLSLGLLDTERPKPPMRDTMDVMLVDKVALRSAAPTPATEAPQAAEAPDKGPTEEAAPEPAPQPAPAPPKPTPAPAPAPKPAPVPAKPTPPAPAKPAPAKPTPAKPAEKAAPPSETKPVKGKPKALALGSDFLKGIPAEKSAGKAQTPRAAVIDAQAAAGLQALIASQVKPCYTVPEGGSDTQIIVSRVHLRLKPDGSIGIIPEVVGNSGITPTNQPYVRQMNEAAVRAIQRCAPYKLPAELYSGGWENIIFTFRPSTMN